MSRYSNYYEIFPKDGKDNYDLLLDTALLLFSGAWLGVTGLVGFALFKTVQNSKKTLLNKLDNHKEKEVVIVRGVPGVGKNKYVYYNELNNKRHFTVCSSDKFYYENNKYHFDRKKINQAEAYCLQQFHQAMKLNVPRVYLTNVNHQKWMYANYVKLAESYQYKVSVVTLLCNDENELRYFNSRSRHNVPMNFSRKVFDEWEVDVNESVIEPYIGNEEGYLEGDSLPFPQKSEDELNKELDEYHSQECLVDSEQEGQIEEDSEDQVNEVEEEEAEHDEVEEETQEEEEEYDEVENTDIVTIVTPEEEEIVKQRDIVLEHIRDEDELLVFRADLSESEHTRLKGLRGYLL